MFSFFVGLRLAFNGLLLKIIGTMIVYTRGGSSLILFEKTNPRRALCNTRIPEPDLEEASRSFGGVSSSRQYIYKVKTSQDALVLTRICMQIDLM